MMDNITNSPDSSTWSTEDDKYKTLKEQTEPYRWKKGESGNPGGRPKDPGITAGQIEKLDQVCPFDGKGRTWREYLIEKGLLQAGESPKAMEHLKERLEGKVPDKHEIETGDISIVYKQVDKNSK